MSKETTTYYDASAARYDELHGVEQNPEHLEALERSWPLVSRLNLRSVVDVGCGTGRTLQWFQQHAESLQLLGVDPSRGLLEVARSKLPGVVLSVGSGDRLPLDDNAVDLAVATGIMHHVDHPQEVIRELFRVARRAVLVSDHNNFAFGGLAARRLRAWLHASGLLGAVTFAKQGFRKKGYSEDDGWWYPYSLLNDYGLFGRLSAEQYLIPTRPINSNRLDAFPLVQSHLAILAIKTPQQD